MKTGRWWGGALLAALTAVGPMGAQMALPAESEGAAVKGAEIHFQFENSQLQPSRFDMVIRQDGTGHFQSVSGPVSVQGSGGIEAGAIDRDILVRDPLLSSMFAVARARKYFAVVCEAKAKVAYRGTKILSYRGPEGQGACTFNWSKDREIQGIAESLESVAMTLEYGRRLEIEHQHNRLALDGELQYLTENAKDKQVMEIENIAPVLQSIADDETVMNRARQRARALLLGEKPR